MGTGSMLLYMLVVVVALWFLLIRPQQAQAKKRAEMLTSLRVGDRVVTIGGICGVIRTISDTKIRIEIADGITIEMLRNAISQLEDAGSVMDEEDEEEDEEEDDIYYEEDDEEDVVNLEKERH